MNVERLTTHTSKILYPKKLYAFIKAKRCYSSVVSALKSDGVAKRDTRINIFINRCDIYLNSSSIEEGGIKESILVFCNTLY